MVLMIAASSAFHRRHINPDDELTVGVHQHAMQIAESLIASPPPPAAPPPTETATCTEACYEVRKPDSSEAIEEKTVAADEWKDVFVEDEGEDTMEATWKAITGGEKERAEKKRLKKSETWEVPLRRSAAVQRVDSEELVQTTPKWRELRKAETFNDAVSIMRRGGLIRRDPSMSLEEFNLQVETFIKKFNDNMRLERRESKQRFVDMSNRGL